MHWVGAECSTTQPAVRRTTTTPVLTGRAVDKYRASPSHGTYNEHIRQEFSTYHLTYIQDVADKCLMKQLPRERRYTTSPLSHLPIVLFEMQLGQCLQRWVPELGVSGTNAEWSIKEKVLRGAPGVRTNVQRILAAKLSCGMRPTTPRPNLELSATGHYFIDFDVTQSPDWTPHRSDPGVRPNAFQKPS